MIKGGASGNARIPLSFLNGRQRMESQRASLFSLGASRLRRKTEMSGCKPCKTSSPHLSPLSQSPCSLESRPHEPHVPYSTSASSKLLLKRGNRWWAHGSVQAEYTGVHNIALYKNHQCQCALICGCDKDPLTVTK